MFFEFYHSVFTGFFLNHTVDHPILALFRNVFRLDVFLFR